MQAFPLRLGVFRFTLCPREPLKLPSHNQTNVLRGFFGHAFRQLCCVPQCSEPRLCPLGQLKCAYADIFSPSPSPEAERLCRNQDIPRPFIFRPLCSGRSIFLVRESFHFELILIGRAIESLPLDWTHKGPPSQAGQ